MPRLFFKSGTLIKKLLIAALGIAVSLFIAINVSEDSKKNLTPRICPKLFHCILVEEKEHHSNSILRSLVSEVHPEFVISQLVLRQERGWLERLYKGYKTDVVQDELAADYQQMIAAVPSLAETTTTFGWIKKSKKVLVAGVGALPVAHFIQSRFSNIEINELLLNDEIFNLTRKWVGPFPWKTVDIATINGNYDVIVFDQCSNYICPSDDSLRIAVLLRDALKDGGVFVTNINAAARRLMRRNFKKVNRTLTEAFGACVTMDKHNQHEANRVFVCEKGVKDPVKLQKKMKYKAKSMDDYLNVSSVIFR